MSLAVETSGTQVCVIGTEHTLATISTNRILIMVLDLANAAAGDTFELRVKTRVLTAGVTREFVLGTFTGAQAQPITQSLPVDSPFEAIFTVKQTAGIGRSVTWRVDSIGAVTIENSGTQTSIISTEHTLHTEPDLRNLSLIVDLAAMLAGDTVELRCKMRVLFAGVTREHVLGTYSGVQAQPIVQSIPIDSPYESIFTLKQTAGSARDYPWRVDSF